MSTAAAAPPPATGPSIPAGEASPLLTSFASFLTVAVHSLLYHRNLYPPHTFLAARAYNLPVHQSRHPRVCAWVLDAVSAVAAQLHAGAARRVVFVVHGLPPRLGVLERWVFDVQSFPAWGSQGERWVWDRDSTRSVPVLEEEGGGGGGAGGGGDDDAQHPEMMGGDDGVNWTDVNEALRGALGRIAYAAQSMKPLPDGCTFTLALELRDEAPAPIGHPQPWIPSSSNLQPPTKARPDQGASLGGSATVPVRSVRADPLFFECWVEQGDPETEANSVSDDDDDDDDDTPTPTRKRKHPKNR